MSPYYTGPVPTAPRFWDMKGTSAPLDGSLDRVFQMPGHFDLRAPKQDSPEVVSSPESECYTPALSQDGFATTVFYTPESNKTPERRSHMYHRQGSPGSPVISPSPSPTESMFSRPSRPDSATSFVESDEGQGPKRQQSSVPSLVVTDYDSDEDRRSSAGHSSVGASPARAAFAHPRPAELRAEATAFRPMARDVRQITSPSLAGDVSTPVVRPHARAVLQKKVPPQYTLPPRSHPFGHAVPMPTAASATVAPRYKQAPAFQVVPRRFPTPKPILAMRMATGPQQPVAAHHNRTFKPQLAQPATLYDSRGQTFENKALAIRSPAPRVPVMPLSSVRHLWPASSAPLPNASTNSNVWHPSVREARSIMSIQQARILKDFVNGIPHGGGLYLPAPFEEDSV